SEGLGRFVKQALTVEFKRNPLNMLGALIARGAIRSFSRRMNPSRYNGASLLGLRGLVFKSHGGENAYGYEWAIRRAYEAARHDVLSRISDTLVQMMPGDPAAGDPAVLAPVRIEPSPNDKLHGHL